MTRGAALRRGASAVAGFAAVSRAAPARAADTEAVVAVRGLISLERRLAAAYATAADAGALRRLAGEGPGYLRDQELRHEEALRAALARLGAEPPESGAGPPALDPGSGEAEIARRLIELESSAVAAYLDALQSLPGGALAQTLTRIVANEGQHLALLRDAVNRPPVARALESGDLRF